jgi:hypothetical protein
MITPQPDDDAHGDAVRSIPGARRKRVRLYSLVVLVGALVFYAAGLFSYPLLFRASANVPVGNRIAQIGAPPCRGPARGPELRHLSVAQAYQALAQEVRELGSYNYAASELGDGLAGLEREVRQLRVLNPYYRFKEIRYEVMPAGTPLTYGEELNVSFDQVQASINVMRNFDPTYGKDGIVLSDDNLRRYVQVGSATACLYCCDARTLVDPKGVAACGCAHSQAMRGLAAYLITNYRDDYTDEELVEELNRWRAVYFPKQTLTEALVEQRNAGEPGIQEIMDEFPEFMPQMVGGC